ncbi:MAG: FKBP-type peptidyl-prolyl cis-trans isomerase [Bacteroidales bacterium]
MKNTTIIILLFTTMFYCCNDDVEPRTPEQEDHEFKEFVNRMEDEKKITLEQTQDGLYYCFDTLGNPDYPIAIGDSIISQYTLVNIANGYVIDGTGSERTFNFVYGGHDDTSLIKGFNYSVGMSRLHSTGNFLFKSDLAYGSTGSGYIEPYSSLYFQIKIVDIYRNGESLTEQDK